MAETLTDTLAMTMHIAFQDVGAFGGMIKELRQANWRMCNESKVDIKWGGTTDWPSASVSANVYDNDSARDAVHQLVSAANTNFSGDTQKMMTITDSSVDQIDGKSISNSWIIDGYCQALGVEVWIDPTTEDLSTHGQPFLIVETESYTDAAGGEMTRFYFLWWDLQHSNSSDTFIATSPLWDPTTKAASLPGWQAENNIEGLANMWRNDPSLATYRDSYIWGDWIGEWFQSTPVGTPIPGQLLLVEQSPTPDPTPTPTPTPSAVSGAGPGEITYYGESIATLIPGFNDQLAKIWRPVAHAQRISFTAKPLSGWEPTPKELQAWARNCKSVPIIVEWSLKK
jgi:hypothetical protein